MQKFAGSGVALVTPFFSDGSIDFNGLKKLVQAQIKGGTDVLVVQGTTGESPTLTADEKKKVLETVLEENNGQRTIIYGCGGNDTAAVAKAFSGIPSGVDGILSVAPYYNKPIQKGFVAHYKAIADATDLPIIMYNVPGRTGSNMTAETTLELAEVKNIVAMKEASGNMDQIMEIIRMKPAGFLLLSGDDAITLPLIAAGAEGVISVVANAFPERFANMVHSALKGDMETARKEHYELLYITRLFFAEGNPGGVKVALKANGWMEEYMRLPLVPVSDELRAKIDAETKRINS